MNAYDRLDELEKATATWSLKDYRWVCTDVRGDPEAIKRITKWCVK